jgi:ElaB/YqjD/DUF883 family membrane-anchored ribosome-binding protein
MVAEQRMRGGGGLQQGQTGGGGEQGQGQSQSQGQSKGQGEGGAGGMVGLGKSKIAGQISQAAEALRGTGQRMVGEGQEASGLSKLVDQAAERLSKVGEHIENTEPRELVRDVEELARRRPEVFIGAAVVAGLVLGRFLRSRPPEEDGARESNLGQGGEMESDRPVVSEVYVERRFEVGGGEVGDGY